MKHFTKEQMQRARRTDLYEFIIRSHMDTHKREGQSLHPMNNRSLSIKKSYCGFMDFANGETGNSVDYLVRHLGYSIDDAVLSLIGDTADGERKSKERTDVVPEERGIVLPEPTPGRYRQLFAYLLNRGIPADVIQNLIWNGLIYQSREKNNIVFVNKEKDWAELRGTYTFAKEPFHGLVKNSRKDGFWWFRTASDSKKAYICESSIDAISLCLLLNRNGEREKAYFISIGGVTKQPAIDRIKRQMKTIIAVDNDDAGGECRLRNQDLGTIIPRFKDWNEDLMAMK